MSSDIPLMAGIFKRKGRKGKPYQRTVMGLLMNKKNQFWEIWNSSKGAALLCFCLCLLSGVVSAQNLDIRPLGTDPWVTGPESLTNGGVTLSNPVRLPQCTQRVPLWVVDVGIAIPDAHGRLSMVVGGDTFYHSRRSKQDCELLTRTLLFHCKEIQLMPPLESYYEAECRSDADCTRNSFGIGVVIPHRESASLHLSTRSVIGSFSVRMTFVSVTMLAAGTPFPATPIRHEARRSAIGYKGIFVAKRNCMMTPVTRSASHTVGLRSVNTTHATWNVFRPATERVIADIAIRRFFLRRWYRTERADIGSNCWRIIRSISFPASRTSGRT